MLESTIVTACNNKDPKAFHSVDVQKGNQDFTNQCPFTCVYDDCNKSYTTLSHLRRHEDTHENSYRCIENNCGKNFKTKFTLKKHVDNVHLKKNPKKYKCSVCDQEFNKHSWLTRHQYRHTGVKPYVCSKEGCGKRFLIPSKLKRHLKTHEGYTCSKENCGQKFPTWTFYVRHVKTSHPTVHKCQNCEKEFATLSNLKAHSEVHSLERDVFLCPKPNCSRFYFMKRNLTYHLKAYHEKRPFQCTEINCYKAFKSKEDLNAHIAHHDPKKRAHKKKKSRSKPSFAAILAGCVPKKILPPQKITEHENENVSSDDEGDGGILLHSPERETENLTHSSPDGSNQCILHTDFDSNKDNMPFLISVDNSATVSTMDVENQPILNMKETVLERKSIDQHNTIECISV